MVWGLSGDRKKREKREEAALREDEEGKRKNGAAL